MASSSPAYAGMRTRSDERGAVRSSCADAVFSTEIACHDPEHDRRRGMVRGARVRVLDAVGRGAALVALAALGAAAAAVTTAPAATAATSTATVLVDQDSFTTQSSPSATHGKSAYLGLNAGPGAERRAYVRFVVGALPTGASGVTATLRVYSAQASTATFTVSSVSTSWSDSTLAWNNQPAPGAVVASKTGIPAGWVSFDVSSAVRANGTVAFVLRTTSASWVEFTAEDSSAARPPQLALSWGGSDPVLAAVGDIACAPGVASTPARCQQAATAALVAGSAVTAVQTLGDNQYENGTVAEFAAYDASWGAVRVKTHPAVGNHEYGTAGAAGYYGYFGAAAGAAGKGYYSYDLGAWHIVVLNSEIAFGAGSAQDVWFRNDLASHPALCQIAVWHEPVFSSKGPVPSRRLLFQRAYDAKVDIVLNGHEHNYERFALQNPSGVADPAGVRQFVVGTGGQGNWALATPQPTSQVRGTAFGVLMLTLHPTSYDWRFAAIPGASFSDTGTTACH
jgi:hypothetical protein